MSLDLSNEAISNCPNVAKVWVNFNGLGTVAIRSDYGVDSITDNGTGQYTINFTTNFANADYCAVDSAGYSPALYNAGVMTHTYTVSSVSVYLELDVAGVYDYQTVCVLCLGDQ